MRRAAPRARARAVARGWAATAQPRARAARPGPSRRPRGRTAARPALRARPARSAPRRSLQARASCPRGHLVLDPRRVLLERERLGRELDDPLFAVERVLAPDVDVVLGDLDHVVTGPRLHVHPSRRECYRSYVEEVLDASF